MAKILNCQFCDTVTATFIPYSGLLTLGAIVRFEARPSVIKVPGF